MPSLIPECAVALVCVEFLDDLPSHRFIERLRMGDFSSCEREQRLGLLGVVVAA